MEFGADDGGGRSRLVVADGGDFGLGMRRGADLAVGGDGDGDLMPQPLVLRQRAGTEEFDVVRMRADGQNLHDCFSISRNYGKGLCYVETARRIASAAAFSCASVNREGMGSKTARANKASLAGHAPFA